MGTLKSVVKWGARPICVQQAHAVRGQLLEASWKNKCLSAGGGGAVWWRRGSRAAGREGLVARTRMSGCDCPLWEFPTLSCTPWGGGGDGLWGLDPPPSAGGTFLGLAGVLQAPKRGEPEAALVSPGFPWRSACSRLVGRTQVTAQGATSLVCAARPLGTAFGVRRTAHETAVWF